MDGGQSPVRPVWKLLRRMLRISYIPKLEHQGGLLPGSSVRVAQNLKIVPEFPYHPVKSNL